MTKIYSRKRQYVFFKFADDLERQLETFRNNIYRVKPEYRNPAPVNGLFFENGIIEEKLHKAKIDCRTMSIEL